jgi:tetratricopeptide (TPR) repeat protein
MGRLTAMKIIPLVISLTTFWVTGVNFMAPVSAKNLSRRVNCDYDNHGKLNTDRQQRLHHRQDLDIYTESIAKLPTAKAYLDRGSIYLELGQYAKALDDCNKAISLEPESGAHI